MATSTYIITRLVAAVAAGWNALDDGAHSLRLEGDFVVGLAIVGVIDECCGGGFYFEVNARSLYGGDAAAEVGARGDVKTLAEAKGLAEQALADFSDSIEATVT